MSEPATPPLRKVYVIQFVECGLFITSEMGYCRSLADAGRLYDYDEAEEIALEEARNGDHCVIHSFWEPRSDH